MSDIGEKAFLRSLLPDLNAAPSFINGFGHDASVIDVGLEELLAFKIDRAPFPISIKKGVGSYRAWGRLAVAANVSDLLAVGAKPRALMISIVVPGSFEVESVRDIVAGCEEACAAHNIVFLGGDTKEGASPQVIGAALGTVKKDEVFGRGRANPGDYLFVAGELGSFAGAVALLDASNSEPSVIKESTDILNNPMARIKEGAYMSNSRSVAAACDLSDGLYEAVNIFCAGGAGISLSETVLPMASLAVLASERYGVPLWQLAFGVGDWAIACVVKESDIEFFRAGISPGFLLHEVGRFNSSGRKVILDKTGVAREMPLIINEHFRQRAEDGGAYSEELMRKR
ncbi:AIR synthase related protein [Pseudomonas viridiflava]|uniref:AIR synthase related protein n=1 Tax=Pseudomonas viridiflava TaxID=33069 RepID=UPI0013DBCB92|nr:AIR synthase related protein [Pseudomonas viridiflava]MEE4149181.1 AIR synthase related protein [Pseudomonas viridiflava]